MRMRTPIILAAATLGALALLAAPGSRAYFAINWFRIALHSFRWLLLLISTGTLKSSTRRWMSLCVFMA